MSKLKKAIFRGDYDSSSSSDEDEIAIAQMLSIGHYQFFMRESEETSKHGGSSSNRRPNLPRGRVAAGERLMNDYFIERPLYPATTFRRRFRMSRPLFIRILNAVQQCDDYFTQKPDATGAAGLTGHQKLTAAMRMLAYGMPADAIDEYVKIAESTTIKVVKRFCRAVVHTFQDVYLRSPNAADTARLLSQNADRGFPGMLGSLDCMHWKWEKCPTAWQGQFTGHVDKPTIILEAVASYDLWIWHAFFGMPGSHNDINVLDRSPLFSNLAAGRAPPVNYTVNGHQYTMGYYLADGIYPKWATIVQAIREPQGNKNILFTRMQEACRKDVERAFGVLQARFGIIKGPARMWHQNDLTYIMKACVILHNMIIEDERDGDTEWDADLVRENPLQISRNKTPVFSEFLMKNARIRSSETYHTLRNDLIEHLWERQGHL